MQIEEIFKSKITTKDKSDIAVPTAAVSASATTATTSTGQSALHKAQTVAEKLRLAKNAADKYVLIDNSKKKRIF